MEFSHVHSLSCSLEADSLQQQQLWDGGQKIHSQDRRGVEEYRIPASGDVQVSQRSRPLDDLLRSCIPHI